MFVEPPSAVIRLGNAWTAFRQATQEDSGGVRRLQTHLFRRKLLRMLADVWKAHS